MISSRPPNDGPLEKMAAGAGFMRAYIQQEGEPRDQVMQLAPSDLLVEVEFSDNDISLTQQPAKLVGKGYSLVDHMDIFAICGDALIAPDHAEILFPVQRINAVRFQLRPLLTGLLSIRIQAVLGSQIIASLRKVYQVVNGQIEPEIASYLTLPKRCGPTD